MCFPSRSAEVRFRAAGQRQHVVRILGMGQHPAVECALLTTVARVLGWLRQQQQLLVRRTVPAVPARILQSEPRRGVVPVRNHLSHPSSFPSCWDGCTVAFGGRPGSGHLPSNLCQHETSCLLSVDNLSTSLFRAHAECRCLLASVDSLGEGLDHRWPGSVCCEMLFCAQSLTMHC